MKSFIALCVAAFLVAVACAQSPTSNCGIYSSCATCTPMGGCGWCTYSGMCEAGNSTGSFVGCTGSYWIWTIGYCPATPAPTTTSCSLYGSCTSCTANAGCGWCSFNNQCEQGNYSGSVEGCVAPYWDWYTSQCATNVPTPSPTPENNCYQYTSCSSCTAISPCGWCFLTASCQGGNADGNYGGTCSGPNWAWTTSQCAVTPAPVPTPVNTCSTSTTCQSCTGQANCGWCVYSNVCLVGNQTCSYNGACTGAGWAWTYNTCPATKKE